MATIPDAPDAPDAAISTWAQWETCANTLWVGRDGLLGYVGPAERHQESELHQDGMYVLDYTYKGEQDVLVDGRWRIVPAQHVLWTSPDAWHAHRVSQPIESIYMLLQPKLVAQVWGHTAGGGVPPHLAVVSAPAALEATLLRALREARERRPGHRLLLELLLRQAVIECFRTLCQTDQTGLELPAVATNRTATLAPLTQAVEILRAEHDRPDLTLHEVARRVGFSLFHFSRRFKDELGIPPGQHLRHLRVMHAIPLLARSDLTLDAIAYLSGFGSARRLTDACKDVLGHTPREIRAAGTVQFVTATAPAQEAADA